MKFRFRNLFLIVILALCVALIGWGAPGVQPAQAAEGLADFVPQVLGEKSAPPEKLTLGLVQFVFEQEKVDANIRSAAGLVDDAVARGAELVVLPELWSIGYGLENPASFAEPQATNKTVKFMVEKAKEHKVYICGGYPELGEDGKAYNSAALISPEGEIILNHRKVLLYTPVGEDKLWGAGECFDVVDTPLGRIAILICYDGDFPESWRIVAANKGADLIIHPSAYESPCEVEGWWDKLYEAGCLQNAVWLVSANLAGKNLAGGNYFGGSRVIDPMGNTIASAAYVTDDVRAKSETLVVELDFAKGLRDGKDANGCIVIDRKVDVFRANGL